jgi:hypothetical protein
MAGPTISMTGWRRPEYTGLVLRALEANAGSGRYTLVVALDGGPQADPEVERIVQAQTWPANLIVRKAERHEGCNLTTFAALDTAFGVTDTDYVVHVEDDVLLAADALAWFAWAGERYRADLQVLTVGAWRHDDGWQPDAQRPMNPEEHRQCRRRAFFCCWGWATWRDRWTVMRANWSRESDHTLSWDVRVSQLRGERGMVEVVPMISRAVNIGSMNGTHRGHHPLDYWRGMDADVTPPPEWLEV